MPKMRRRTELTLEIVVLLAALGTIPLTYLQERGTAGVGIAVADWSIWSIFLLDLIVGLSLASGRGPYLKSNWLGVAIVVLSFPALPGILGLTRLARLARLGRLLRLLRLGVVGTRALRTLQSVFGRRGLVYVLSIAVLLTFASGAVLLILEPETVNNVGDALWWAAVTVTTVGYGDIVPKTAIGRLLSVVLMVTGIGVVSALAASIAAHFVGQEEGDQLQHLSEQLDRIEKLLTEGRLSSDDVGES